MQDDITDMTQVTDEIENRFGRNPIAMYLWHENVMQGRYGSMRNLIHDLEYGHCAAGSFSGMIYTRDIRDKLRDDDWLDYIEEAINEYADATGETPDLARDGFHIDSLVTFAVDWYSDELARFLQSQRFYVVTIPCDSLDPSPDKIVFLYHDDMQDYIAENVEDPELITIEEETF